jgi:hypothetical protein
MEKRLIYGMNNTTRYGKLTWLLPVMVGVLISCSKPKTPEGILTQPEMVKALMDIYIAEEKVNRLGLQRDSSVELFDSLKLRTFERLELSDSSFKRSLNYYTSRPREMELIYSALVDSLQLKEQKAPSIIEKLK